MLIQSNINAVRQRIMPDVKLVCVSKFQSNAAIEEAYAVGERIFGESRVQEIVKKHETLPQDIQWHFIGHLQSNKVKYIAPFVSLIQSVDSKRLLQEINNEAAKNRRVIDCLLQVHIAQEETKFGFSATEIFDFLATGEWQKMPFVRLCGLMGMATFTDNATQIRQEMQTLKKIFDKAKIDYLFDNQHFKELSMGMSDDFRIGIEEGSTIVRIGTAIFGKRG